RVLTRDIPAEDIARFARANADLLGDAGAGAAASRDPARVDAFLAHLPPATQALLEELSPQVHVSRLRAPLFLIHGYEDPVVPFTESVALEGAARAAGVPVRLTLVGAVHHVEGGRPGGLRGVADAWRLWASFLSFHEATR